MKKNSTLRLLVVVALGAALLLALVGCVSANNAAEEQQTDNRDYMTQVNIIMNELDKGLERFTDAVSRGDLVGMRTQADNAFKYIDDLKNLEAPDDLKDIQTEYVDGCNDLKDALNSYIDLYSDIETATEGHPFDYSTYDSRLDSIKDKYNSGIDHLENGDKKATEKN